jgi:outer membrane protein OmpA-like peptidoglycan-associated protein
MHLNLWGQTTLKSLYFKKNSTDLTFFSNRQLHKLESSYLKGDLILKSFYVFKDSASRDPQVDTLCEKRLKKAMVDIGVVSKRGLSVGTRILELKPKEDPVKESQKLEIRYTLFSELTKDSLIELQKIAIAENNKIEESAIWNNTKDPNAKPKYNVPYLLNIKFIEGKSKIQSESYAEIERLFKYLKENPNLTLVIRGHVCCGNNDRISKNRARAVYKELSRRGIAKNRMQYVGMSNRDPLVYPEKSNADRQKNRRVDVKLMLLDVNAK